MIVSMKNTFGSFFALSVAFATTPANAQIQGEWESVFGQAQLEVSNSSTQVPEPGWISTWFRSREADPLRGWRNIRFDGRYRGLVWEGMWHMPADRTIVAGMRRCDRTAIPRGGHAYDATPYFGKFRFTFNTAENRFDGVWFNCDRGLPAQPVGYLATYFITGTRLNTYAGRTDNSVRPTGAITSTPNSSGGPPLVDPTMPLDDDAQLERILSRAQFLMIDRTTHRETAVPMSQRYQIRPNIIDALAVDKFQIDFRNPEAKRPIRLAMKGVNILGFFPSSLPDRIGLGIAYNGRIAALGLPFIGEMQAGSAIANRTMPAPFCGSAGWLAYLDFSDGSQSEPIAFLFSKCGAKAHPESLPAPVESRRVKPIRP